MGKLKNWLVFGALCASTPLVGQSVVGDWESYTSTLTIRAVVQKNNYIYGASSGGLVQLDTTSHLFECFDLTAGLSNLDITAMALDTFGNLWLGMAAPQGEINIWNPDAENVSRIFNENVFGEQLTAIAGFTFQGDRAFAICQRNVEWGVLEFVVRDGQYFYKDFYFNLPLEVEQINGIKASGDTLYLGTDKGLIYANYTLANLKQMSSWNTITKNQKEVCKIVTHQGQLLTNFGSELFRIKGDQTIMYNDQFSHPIQDLITTPAGQLIIASPKGVYNLQSGGNWRLYDRESLLSVLSDSSGNLWGGTTQKGFWYSDSQQTRYFTPNTLLSNLCTSLEVDDQGNLLTAALNGFSLLTAQGWYNIVKSGDSVHISDQETDNWDYFFADTIAFNVISRIYDLIKSEQGDYFATLYGSVINDGKKGGLLRFNLNSLAEYMVYDTTDGVIAATAGRGGSDYYLAPYCATLDAEGNLWVGVQNAQNDEVLAVLTPEDQWIHFGIPESNNYLTHFINAITFDAQSRVWISSEVHSEAPFSSGGITVLDYNSTLSDKSDDQWYLVTESNGLADNSVLSVAFDKEETLWIMSAAGIQQALLADNFPDRIFSQIQSPVFANLSFSKECRIRVDERNNVWFTTVDAGVKVYTYEGLWLNGGSGLTTQNSGILSNEVFDIDFYAPEGLVYFATKKGISIYKSPWAVIGRDYKELKIFPIPYKIPNSEHLVIDGLLPGSEVKIITLNGRFIRQLRAEKNTVVGSQAFWDGKDQQGQYVSSGVYLCLAFDQDGHQIVDKIAILRK